MTRFYRMDARIARPRLLAGIAVALPCAWAGMLAARSGTAPIVTAVGAGAGMLLAKLLVEAARRRHDMGRSAGGALALLALAMAGVLAAQVYALGTGAWSVPWVAIALFALLWAATLLGAGTADTNRFGPPASSWRPSFGAPTISGTVSGRRRPSPGLVLAGVLALAGASIGYGGARWVGELAEQHRIDQREAARIAATPEDAGTGDNLEAEYQEQQQ